jgi:two-component system, cell cycle response regulator DivK
MTTEAKLKTILIVEDVELNLDLLTQILEDEYRLLVARDGAEGVALAQREHPDLVLMDISLPVMDGYEATRILRAASPSLPILGLSAHAMRGDVDKALQAGCTDYLTKPVDEVLLLSKIRGHLR